MDHITVPAVSQNGQRRVLCDRRLKTGRRAFKNCGATATHYDVRRRENVCSLHREPDAIRGTGTPWYEDAAFGCDTPGHAAEPVRRVVDNVAMCISCSGEYALEVEMHAADREVA